MSKNSYEFNYPIEFYNPHVHLEYDYNNNINLNEAEKRALELEEYKNKYIEDKILKDKEFAKKYNKNVFLYQEEQKLRNKEEEINKLKEKNEKLIKTKNFNRTVYEKNMKPFTQRYNHSKSLNKLNKASNNKKHKSVKQIKVIDHKNKNINIYNNMEINNDINIDKFVPQKRILQKASIEINNEENNNNNENIILNENFDNDNNYEEKIDENLKQANENKNENINKNIDNPNVVDLRGNIESQLLEEIKHKKRYKNNEINDEINEKINNIRRFRNHGYLPQQEDYVEEKKVKKIKNKKFFSEFERRRFIKALKHIITERLGAHDIYIQNICNCGNLQKQLTALVEKGNLTVYALTEVECANNCVFYKNKKAYLKSINDVLNSIKDIAYENFHNKYKDKI